MSYYVNDYSTYISVAYYSNLEVNKTPKEKLDNNQENPTNLLHTCTTNLLNTGALASYFNHVNNSVMPFVNWFLVETTAENLKFMYFDKESINGIQVARSVTINTDLSWQVQVHGTSIMSEVFTNIRGGPPTKLADKNDLKILLNTIGQQFKLCSGCDNRDFNSLSNPCVDKNGNVTGKLELLTNSHLQKLQTRRSVNCQYIIAKDYKHIRCKSCAKLNKVLCNSLYKSNNCTGQSGKDSASSKSSSTSNWRFLSDHDQKERYLDQQRRRINVERREKYAKRKSEEEKKMLRLTQRDSDNFNVMFRQLDDDMNKTQQQLSINCDSDDTSDDDAFFWSLQREHIQSGKTCWHPRLVNQMDQL